jgi:predicted 2-oxoglutarate/Fe(II)-dependent dioxygenase YbiX
LRPSTNPSRSPVAVNAAAITPAGDQQQPQEIDVPGADFFARFGFFVHQDFLDPESCSRIRSEMMVAPTEPAALAGRGALRDVVDEDTRRTKSAQVSETSEKIVTERLLGLKNELEDHFKIALKKCQNLQFLIYRTGDFFKIHRDSNTDHDSPEYSRERKISIVIFLNNENRSEKSENRSEESMPEQNDYRGGSLTFYLPFAGSEDKTLGFPLIGHAGLLVAFPSDTIHGVSPVTTGERYTVVSWFV